MADFIVRRERCRCGAEYQVSIPVGTLVAVDIAGELAEIPLVEWRRAHRELCAFMLPLSERQQHRAQQRLGGAA